jgi:hypothetical protein
MKSPILQPSLYSLAARGSAGGWFVLGLSLLLCGTLRAVPTAVDDYANTVTNQPVTISVLANDLDAETNQMAILKVTAPAHGTVTINSNSAAPSAELSRLVQFASQQLSNSVAQIGNTSLYPRATQTNGIWATAPLGIYNWVCGFFPGSLWYLYEQTGDAHYRAWAESWTAGIASQQYITNIPDSGFMINNSFGAGYRLTGNAAYSPVVVQAAQSVVTGCYNRAVACIGQLWAANKLAVAIDWMMNLELLFHASALGGDRSLYTNAVSSAEKMMLDNVRADGSTYQIVYYNATTGALMSKGTSDGAADESTWARGQAWGIYGFTMAYRETGDARFLATAQRLADYYLANVASDYVPYWDFQAPGIPNAPRDSSAAAITLSALVQLSQLATNLQDGARYWKAASQIFDSLRSTNYLAQGSHSGGILLHGTGGPPQYSWSEVDVSLIYGDYYFVEALRRYMELYRRTTITYVPNTDFRGTDTFAYQMCDSSGDSATATVTVLVDPAFTNAFAAQISLSPGTQLPTVSFSAVPGRRYFVQFSSNLPAFGHWSVLATNLVGSSALMSVSDTNPASRRFYRAGLEPPPAPPQEVTLPAPLGVVANPFLITNDHIYQPVETGVTNGGRAAYSFTIPNAGNYVIRALVNATNSGANSFYVNIDAEPQDPYMIWDVPLTAGFEEHVVSWRGNGTFDNDEFVPKLFNLAQGSHQLIIRGREAYTLLQNMTILQYP